MTDRFGLSSNSSRILRRTFICLLLLLIPVTKSFPKGPEMTPETDASPNRVDSLASLPLDESAPKLPEGIDRESVLKKARERYENWPKAPELSFAGMGELNIRLLRGNHVEFFTDLPSTPETDGIPEVMDAAVGELCRYFHLDPVDFADWRIEAFLIDDREAFELFGAMEGAPDFLHGYSLYNRLWVYDKKQPYYNRFLLLHEFVHAFMHTAFGDLSPRWYSEGIAEYLALHHWDAKAKKLTLGFLPEDPDQTPGFGRIELIQKALREGEGKSIRDIRNFKPADYVHNETYAWGWAFVALLDHHPRHKDALAGLPYLMMEKDADSLFTGLLGKDGKSLTLDWADLAATFSYGYDFEKTRIDYRHGETLQEEKTIELSLNGGGWQNSGIRLEGGKSYLLSAEGRGKIFDPEFDRLFPTEPNGITLRYFNGRPIGQLLAVVVPETPEKKGDPLAPWDSAIPIIRSKETLTPETSGTLFFRVNLPPAGIARSEGSFSITVREREDSR